MMLKAGSHRSTVIKAGSAGPVLKRLSTVDLADHLGEARGIVDAAKQGAAQALSQAEIERKRMAVEARKAAQEAGYEEGFAEGKRAGHQSAFEESKLEFERQHAGIVAQMQQAISRIDEMKDGLKIAAEKDLLDFAVMLATKLTFSIGRLSREPAVANAKRAIRAVGSKTDLTIRVNPEDLKSMETYASTVLRQIETSTVISVIADEQVTAGGCVVETDRGRVDATLETQIDELTGLLLSDKDAGRESSAAAEYEGQSNV